MHPDFATQMAALMEMTDRDGHEAPREDGDIAKRKAERSPAQS